MGALELLADPLQHCKCDSQPSGLFGCSTIKPIHENPEPKLALRWIACTCPFVSILDGEDGLLQTRRGKTQPSQISQKGQKLVLILQLVALRVQIGGGPALTLGPSTPFRPCSCIGFGCALRFVSTQICFKPIINSAMNISIETRPTRC